jgi:ATP-dependent Lhr-like helicase
VGARVILCDGALVAYLRRGNPNLQVFLPEEEPQRGYVARALAERLAMRVHERAEDGDERAGMLISNINGASAGNHMFAGFLMEAGFSLGATGLYVRKKASAGMTIGGH